METKITPTVKKISKEFLAVKGTTRAYIENEFGTKIYFMRANFRLLRQPTALGIIKYLGLIEIPLWRVNEKIGGSAWILPEDKKLYGLN